MYTTIVRVIQAPLIVAVGLAKVATGRAEASELRERGRLLRAVWLWRTWDEVVPRDDEES